jgi:uracil-DNA glycosylase family 4
MSLKQIENEVVACARCPRLVAWREQTAAQPPRRYRGETYWARPIPGYGDPAARLLVLGLAPAAHGGNRTGRVFTGDRSGDWLFAAMHRAGFASQPTSTHVGDGLVLHDAWVTATVKCAPPDNKPLPEERDACLPFAAAELAALPNLRAMLCLGKFGWDAALRLLRQVGYGIPSPLPRFGHGAQARIEPGLTLIGSYHPSQQNTFTGKLTEAMLDDVFAAARRAIGAPRDG